MEVEIELTKIFGLIFLLVVAIFLLIVFIGTFLNRTKTKKDLSEKEFYDLVSLLNDKNLRKTALERIAKIKDKKSIEIITSFIDSLDTNNPDDRNIMNYAFELISDINDKMVFDFMITTLKGKDTLKKYLALKKISYLVQVKKIKDKSFILPIISLIIEQQELKSKNSEYYNKEIEETGIIILNELTGKNFGYDIGKWVDWVSKNIKT